jgi:hypothetical protein
VRSKSRIEIVAVDRSAQRRPPGRAVVTVEVDAGDDDGNSDECRGEREPDLVVDRLEERPVALVAVGVDGDRLDEPVEVVRVHCSPRWRPRGRRR